MKNDAIIRYDGANGGKTPRHVPSPRAEADKLRELLLDIVEEKLAELTVTQLDDSVTDKELPSAHATWELKQDIDNQVEAAEAAATFALSYAVGGTGSRTGEATDNAKYYAEQAEDASGTAEQAKDEAVNAAGSAVQAKEDAEDAKQAAAESESNAEAWAVGQRNGVDVPSTDETYHNNSKYYAQQAAASAEEALASAIFVINVTLAEAYGEWSVVDVDKTDAEILAAIEADRPIIAIAAQDPTVKVCFYGVDSYYEATEQSESCQLVLYAETTVSNGENNVQLGTRRLQYSYIQNGSEATTGTWTYTADAVNVRQDDAVMEVTATNIGSGIYRTSRTYHDAASAISGGYQLNMTIIDGAKRYQVIGYNTQIVDGVNYLVFYAAAPASDAQLTPTGLAIRVYVWNATAFTYVGEQTIPTKELPNVSAEDNGKVLAVVGGEWEKADPPSAGDPLPDVSSADNGKVLGVVNGEWDKMPAPGGGGLPPVTADDNGDILGVVNGAWSKVTPSGGTDEPFFLKIHIDSGNSIDSIKMGEDEETVTLEDLEGRWIDLDYVYVTSAAGDSFQGKPYFVQENHSGTGNVIFEVLYSIGVSTYSNSVISFRTDITYDEGYNYTSTYRHQVTGVPPATASDNGKVLGVVNGVWDKMAVPSGGGLPAVTSDDNGDILTVINGAWGKGDAHYTVSPFVVAEEQSVTPVQNGTVYVASFIPTAVNTPRPANMTIVVDGTSYVLPKVEKEGADYYGEFNGRLPDFTTYPCLIEFGYTVPMIRAIYFPQAGTHTIKIYAESVEVVTPSNSFKGAVKACGAPGYDITTNDIQVVPSQSVTTAGTGAFAVGELENCVWEGELTPYITVTMDNQTYTLPQIVEGTDSYGYMSGNLPDFTIVPCCVAMANGTSQFFTQTAGTYTVSITAPEKVVTPDEDFTKAVETLGIKAGYAVGAPFVMIDDQGIGYAWDYSEEVAYYSTLEVTYKESTLPSVVTAVYNDTEYKLNLQTDSNGDYYGDKTFTDIPFWIDFSTMSAEVTIYAPDSMAYESATLVVTTEGDIVPSEDFKKAVKACGAPGYDVALVDAEIFASQSVTTQSLGGVYGAVITTAAVPLNPLPEKITVIMDGTTYADVTHHMDSTFGVEVYGDTTFANYPFAIAWNDATSASFLTQAAGTYTVAISGKIGKTVTPDDNFKEAAKNSFSIHTYTVTYADGTTATLKNVEVV